LRKAVTVDWGGYSVPHVTAESELDLFTAQGYLHAAERLWQMDFNRRFLSGRLAETFGQRALPWNDPSIKLHAATVTDLDYFLRVMGIRRAAVKSLQVLPEALVACLRAYAAGVNRYIERHVKSLPFEFRLLRYEPDPWRPEDSLTIGKGFAMFLSLSMVARLTLNAVARKLGERPEQYRSLVPRASDETPTITRLAEDSSSDLFHFLNGTFGQTGWLDGGQGSNGWAVAPARSTTGRAILCNDPHLRLDLPSVWYLMHLKAAYDEAGGPGMDAWGATIPGTPCVQLGRNRMIAWGVTAALCDDATLYVEKISPDDPDCYLAGTSWLKMERLEERIDVRGGSPCLKTVRITRHGPVITDALAGSGPDQVLALRWTAHEASQEFRVVHGINRAQNWNEFLASLSHQTAPALNYLYADIKGNIGYSLTGKIAKRGRPAALVPLPGWSDDHEWDPYIPFDDLPRLYNPPEGIIAVANNAIADANYPYHLSHLFEPPYRIRRIAELLSAKKRWSPADMEKIQTDVVSVQARTILDRLKTDLREIAASNGSLGPPVELLLQWDGSCSEGSPGAALFHAFYARFMRMLLAPALGGDLFRSYADLFNLALSPIDRILCDARSPWYDSVPRRSLLESSLREAVNELARSLGQEIKKWRWGDLHQLKLTHVLGKKGLLDALLSLPPFPTPGDWVTVNMGFYRHSNPYHQTVGASLRMIIDVGDQRPARFILPSGQSGHFLSPHYRDQTDLWRRGLYLDLAVDSTASATRDRLTLTPSAGQS
jgi:penicillin amidase